MTAFGYARGSTARQVLTLEVQAEKLEAYYRSRLAETHIWGGIFSDPGESAFATFFTQRPAGRELDHRMERGDQVLICKMDRGFRSPRDAAVMGDVWAKRGIGLHVIDIGLDTSSPQGRLVLGMLSYFGAFESEMISERISSVMQYRIQNDLPNGGIAPFGWQSVKIPGEKYQRFAADHYERMTMRFLVKLRIAGTDWPTIQRILDRKKFKHRNWRNNPKWSRTRVQRMTWAGMMMVEWEMNPGAKEWWCSLRGCLTDADCHISRIAERNSVPSESWGLSPQLKPSEQCSTSPNAEQPLIVPNPPETVEEKSTPPPSGREETSSMFGCLDSDTTPGTLSPSSTDLE